MMVTITEALEEYRKTLRELKEYNRATRLPMTRPNWDAYKEHRGLTEAQMDYYFVVISE